MDMEEPEILQSSLGSRERRKNLNRFSHFINSNLFSNKLHELYITTRVQKMCGNCDVSPPLISYPKPNNQLIKGLHRFSIFSMDYLHIC